jgi:hypothetical protein
MQRKHVLGYARLIASMALTAVLVCVCAFWARSYAWSDRLMGPLPRSHMFQAYTWRGTVHLIISGPAYRLDLWEFYSSPVPRADAIPSADVRSLGLLGFSLWEAQGIWHVTAPMWFLAVLAGGILAAIWRHHIRRRFSLRTMLIATTLVALVLGLMAILRAS